MTCNGVCIRAFIIHPIISEVWPNGVVVRTLETLGKLFTLMCLCHKAVANDQRAMMPYGWEGNRRYGVMLAMRDRLQWFIHLRDQWLKAKFHYAS